MIDYLHLSGGVLLKGTSERQLLNHLMTLMPTYSWREIGGVVVVRPKDAWDDPTNVLNLPTKPFEATNMMLGEVLHAAASGGNAGSVPGP